MGSNIKVGRYKNYTFCRFCQKKNLKPVINLGYVPLAGGFLIPKNFKHEKFYPLELAFCENCLLLQSVNVINKNILFNNYFYFSSKIETLVNYFNNISFDLKKTFKNPKDKFILEIGSNDGVLLNKLNELGFRALGIEPARNVVKSIANKNITIINDFFTKSQAKKIVKKYGKANAIVSFNTLAHIEDMRNVMSGIKLLLKENGFLEFGVHYLGKLIKEQQFDVIYHEHQYYYSILALKNFFDLFDMEIYNVRQTNMHAGSIIVFAQNKYYGKNKVNKNIENMIKKELRQGLDKTKTYIKFMEYVAKSKNELLTMLKKIKAKNKKIIGYGASGRGTILMNYYDLTKKTIDCLVDDAPAKQGMYAPGNHLKIFPSSILYGKTKPDYVLLLAWSFIKEIKKKHKKFLQNGGRFIVPLPKVKIISK